MATYPIKVLKDEQGEPFIPLTEVKAVMGEEYTIGILNATQVIEGHYKIVNEHLDLLNITNQIIAIQFPEITSTSITSYLQLNDETEYPIYQIDGTTPLLLSTISNGAGFFKFTGSQYNLVKIGTSSEESGGGHVIIDNTGNILPQRPSLTFKGMDVSDDTTTGSTVVNGPVLINNLSTIENNQGALDAYQGKVLNDKIPEVIDNVITNDAAKALSAKQGKELNEKIPEVVDNLNTDNSNKALSAKQGKELNDKIPGVINDLDSDDTTNALSAAQGKALNNKISGIITKDELLDLIYPIGAIYLSVSFINPDLVLGGTWERLEDRFLVGAGSDHSIGATGGSSTHDHYMSHTHSFSHTHNVPGSSHSHQTYNHTLTKSEMPNHNHDMYRSIMTYYQDGSSTVTNGIGNTGTGYYFYTTSDGGDSSHNHGSTSSTTPSSVTTNSQSNSTTGSGSRSYTDDANNLPPYLSVYMWKRVA